MSDHPSTYTLYKDESRLEFDDQIVARNLSIKDAALAIRERDGGMAYVAHHDHGDFRAFELRKFNVKSKLKLVIGATVPATKDFVLDRAAAERLIDVQTVARCREFCDLSVSTDVEFDTRIQRVTDRRAVKKLEHQIVTELIDRLIADGYRITACARWDNPPFRNSRRRDAILALLFDLDMAELLVTKKGETFWILLIFGEDGWDVIADHSTDLSDLINPILEPHLPWNKPGSHDRGYTIFRLPSPAQLERGEPGAVAAVDDFFSTMAKGF
jgi:hypothetical protein